MRRTVGLGIVTLFLLVVGMLVLLFFKRGEEPGRHVWSKTFRAWSYDVGEAVATDSEGNVLVAGDFKDGIILSKNSISSLGGKDIFVAKFSRRGEHLWSHRFGGPQTDHVRAIAVDRGNNSLIAGFFSREIDFGGGPLAGDGAFLLKLSPTGGHVWSRQYPNNVEIAAISVDNASNIALSGAFWGKWEIGGTSLNSSKGHDLFGKAFYNQDAFIAKLSPTGELLWVQSLVLNMRIGSGAVALDNEGNILLVGDYQGEIRLGERPLACAIGQTCSFALKLSPTGSHIWSRTLSSSHSWASGVAIDKGGNVLITGSMWDAADFGGGPLRSTGGSDIFLVKLSPTGSHLWSDRFGGSENDLGKSVAVDKDGNVVFAGAVYEDSVSFGGRALSGFGSLDIFIAKLSPSGVHVWSHRIGNADSDVPNAISVDRNGDVYTTGGFSGDVIFGKSKWESAGGLRDTFLVKHSK